QDERPQDSAAVPREHIETDHRRNLRTAVYIASGDGAAPAGVRVLRHRLDVARQPHPRSVHMRPLEYRPAVVLATLARRRAEVDLLPCVLADVAYVEVTRGTIKAESPGSTHSVCPDLVTSPASQVGIAGRHRVWTGRLDLDPQDLSEQCRKALPVALGRVARADIACVPSVAHSDVRVSVGSERNQTAVVVGLRLRDGRQRLARRAPRLLNDEHTTRAIAGTRYVNRTPQARRDPCELE